MPNTILLTPTMAPALGKLATREAPFYRKGLHGGLVQAWLTLDMTIRHIDVVFTSKPASREQTPILDHDGGLVYLPLPSELTGYLADSILLSDRVQRMLGYLLMSSYHSAETGILVEEPLQFEATASKLVDMMLDHAGFEDVVTVDTLTLHDLQLKGVDRQGNSRRTPEGIHHVYDKILGIDIITEADMERSLAVRIQKASARGVYMQGLRKRMRLLLAMVRGGDKSAVLPATSQDDVVIAPLPHESRGTGVAQKANDEANRIRPPDAEIITLAEPAVELSPRGARQKESPYTLDMFGPDEAVASRKLDTPNCAHPIGSKPRWRPCCWQVDTQPPGKAPRCSPPRLVARRSHKPARAAPTRGHGPIVPDSLCHGPSVPRALMDLFAF